jgi:hypothetical protein
MNWTEYQSMFWKVVPLQSAAKTVGAPIQAETETKS